MRIMATDLKGFVKWQRVNDVIFIDPRFFNESIWYLRTILPGETEITISSQFATKCRGRIMDSKQTAGS